MIYTANMDKKEITDYIKRKIKDNGYTQYKIAKNGLQVGCKFY